MSEWRYGMSGRRGENNVYHGRLAAKGEWFDDEGSRFTPTGVHWSNKAMDRQERADREEQGRWHWSYQEEG